MFVLLKSSLDFHQSSFNFAKFCCTLLLLTLPFLSSRVSSFHVPPSQTVYSRCQPSYNFLIHNANSIVSNPASKLRFHDGDRKNKGNGSTQLKAALLPNLPSVLSKISPPLRNSIILGSAAIAIYKNRQKFFYPGSAADPNFSEPLPPGSMGCPFIGNLGIFLKNGTPEKGPGQFFNRQAELTSSPTIFKYMFMKKPVAMVSGMKNVKAAFNNEFKTIKTGPALKTLQSVIGKGNLLVETDANRHRYLRGLMGQALTPESIEKAMPALVAGATAQIDSLALQPDVAMESICTNYTLDVAWRQILGLDLSDDEVPIFYENINNWIRGISDPKTHLLPGVENSECAKARQYIVSKIERKIEDLHKNGPDASTLSAMVFAKDEEDEAKRLSHDEIVSNSLILILAGTETAASSLTVASLALGIHKDTFTKLKEEQREFVEKHGEDLTNKLGFLEKECPYLDAVIKETMRIAPLAGTGTPRRFAQETFVLDGKQIPKGYGVVFNVYLTHANDPVVKMEGDAHMDISKGFRPERWLNQKTKPTEFMPFGCGPRFCLGASLAMAEMKVFLSLFARRVNYDLVNSKDEIIWKKTSILPKPEDGTLVHVTSVSN